MALSTRIRPLLSTNTPKVTSRFLTRAMASSTSTPAKFDWLVILPDGEGKLADRMAVRPDHFANLQPNVENGFWKMGGALLTEPPKEGDALKITGSCMMAHAATKEEVIEQLKADVYFKSGVWDFEKMQIWPFKTAFRHP